MVAAGAAPLDLDVEHLDDLLLVVDQVVEEAMLGAGTEGMTIGLDVEGDELTLRVAAVPPGPPDRSPLLERLVAGLGPGYRVEWGNGDAAGVAITARTRR